MEQNKFLIMNKSENSNTYRIFGLFIFPVCIILMSFFRINRGIDISDSTYSVTNYLFLDRLDSMWYYSTFYANLLGGLLIKLPFGKTLLGINFYSSLFKCALGLLAYYFSIYKVKLNYCISFILSFVSVSLCWCPSTILYNYMTYFLFYLGAFFLYKGLTEKKTGYLVIAGVILGSNVFVRLPNVAECALILCLWTDSFVRKEKFSDGFKKTLWCVLGYIFALLIGFLSIIFTRGISEYFNGIKELFAMTSEAPSYSTFAMIISVIRSYIEALKWCPYVIIAFALAYVITKLSDRINRYIKYILYFFIGLVLLAVLYKTGMFYRNFKTFESLYRLSAWVMMFAVFFDIYIVFSKKYDANDKLLATISVIIIAITPLGSNNSIYSNINNMFWILPVLARFLYKTAKDNTGVEGINCVIAVIAMIFCVNGIIFGFSYNFRDGLTNPLNSKVYNNERLTNVFTTEDNAVRLSELSEVFVNPDLANKKLLLYGNVSGLGFILNREVSISTAWPSLESFSLSKFSKDMNALSLEIDKIEALAPVVIIGTEEQDGIETGATAKQEILKDFLDKYNYKVIYNNDKLLVYSR